MGGLSAPYITVVLLLAAPFIWLQAYLLAWVTGPALRHVGRRFGEGLEQGKWTFRREHTGELEGTQAVWRPSSGPGRPREELRPVSETEIAPQPRTPVPAEAAVAQGLSQQSTPVYTYTAPGQPLCPKCGRFPAVFYCVRHDLSMCLNCVGAHDVATECSYVPAFRAEKPGSKEGPTHGGTETPRKHKPGDVFGIS